MIFIWILFLNVEIVILADIAFLRSWVVHLSILILTLYLIKLSFYFIHLLKHSSHSLFIFWPIFWCIYHQLRFFAFSIRAFYWLFCFIILRLTIFFKLLFLHLRHIALIIIYNWFCIFWSSRLPIELHMISLYLSLWVNIFL